MDYRNAVFIADGRIDCEIDHPKFGWIPFTASPGDPEEFGRELFAELKSKAAAHVPHKVTAEDVAAELAQARAAASMSRRAFAILAMKEKWITPAEAKAWAPGNGLPEVVITAILANYTTDEDRAEAEINASTQTVIHRNDALLVILMAVKEVTPEQMDAHFGIGET